MITPPPVHPPNRSFVIVHCSLFIAILLLAAGLRLTRLDLVEFKYDEAHMSAYAQDVASGEDFHLVGLGSSVGGANPPLAVWLFAIPYGLSHNPLVATGFVAALGVLTVGGTYLVARCWLGTKAGLVAALLFAVSPWAVFNARKIWAQDLLPPFMVLFVLACVNAFVKRKPWHLVLAFLWLACLVQIHLSGLALVPLLALLLSIFHRQVRWRPLLSGTGIAALTFVPYLVGQMQRGWADVRVFLEVVIGKASITLDALEYALLIVGGRGFHALAGGAYEEFLAWLPSLYWPDRLEEGLFVGALGFLAWRAARDWRAASPLKRDRARLALLLLLAWVIPVACFLRHSIPVYPHYFIVLYPLPYWAMGWMLQEALGWMERQGVVRWVTVVVILALLALVAWQVVLQEALLTFVDAHDTPGGYGAPIKYALAATRRAEGLVAEAGDAELIVLLPGADPRYDGQAAIFDILLRLDYRPVDGRQALVLPARPAVVLADPGAEPAVAALVEVATEAGPALPLRGGSGAMYRFFRWQPVVVTPAHPWDGEPVRWALRPGSGQASGATLLGYDWSGDPRPGGMVHWTLYWRVEGQPPAGSDVHWFNHLVDGEGNRWGQMDGVGYPAPEWRVGDTVLTWFDIAISPDAPPSPYFVRSGMYTYPDVVNIPLVDVAGSPVGEFVELGPVERNGY